MQQDMLKDDKTGVDGDLWIQALTYFRDLKSMDEVEKYLEQALDYIGQNNVLSPLLVLEILSDTKNKNAENKQDDNTSRKKIESGVKTNKLRFKVLKKFLLGKLKQQVEVIDKNADKVDDISKTIGGMKQEIVRMK